MADEWWGRQKGLRQTLRTEVAVGGKGPDAQLDRWAITIRFEDGAGRRVPFRQRPLRCVEFGADPFGLPTIHPLCVLPPRG